MSSPGSRPKAEGPDAERAVNPPPATGAGSEDSPNPEVPGRRWVWMDRWDPGTWEMPSNPTKLQRVLAGVALVIIAVMTLYVPFKVLGVF
ncbi:MAG: hypothetical protein JWN73_2106 [Betaproteobacteria bacterium]|nr:hypothetical protein [Betaproteobacteria bacterium]